MAGLGLGLGIAQRHRRQSDSLALGWAALDRRLAFARAGAASYVDAAGLVKSAASGDPALDHDPVSFAPSGLVVGEQRTNLFAYSEQLAHAPWDTRQLAVSSDRAMAPSGELTADKLIESTVAGQSHKLILSQAYAAGSWTLSIFAKAAERGTLRIQMNAVTDTSIAVFDLQNGAISTTDPTVAAAIAPAGNGWFRCTMTGPASAPGSYYQQFYLALADGSSTYSGDGVSGCYLWGAQLEAGAFPTGYIPTNGAAATRAADSCTTGHADFTGWLARTQKTVVVTADSPASGTRRVFYAAKTGNEANDSISIWTSGTAVRATVVAGGATQADLTLGTIAAGVPFTVALSLADDAVQASLDGAAKVTHAAATIPVCDKLWFGCGPDGEQLCGHLSGTWRFLPGIGDVEALSAQRPE